LQQEFIRESHQAILHLPLHLRKPDASNYLSVSFTQRQATGTSSPRVVISQQLLLPARLKPTAEIIDVLKQSF
jgi:hypothetical protein